MTENPVIVVTGASRGIGRAIAVALTEPGARVVVNYHSKTGEAQETAAAIEAREGVPRLCRFNVANEEAVKEAFKQILQEFKKVDILVNNAGVTRDNLLALMKPSEWDEVIHTNLRGAFLCSQAVVKSMMRQKYGRIVNVTSVVGVTGNAGQCNYSASKAGMIGLTRSLAHELISRNITVNAVAPGFIETDMTLSLPEKSREALLDHIPAGRYGTPEDVAAAVKFLASETAGYITGQVIHVNGGMYMG
ncbi:MAG: 3-oxoacyl-[acyl-carrier-protein] reductase [Syntrophobacteraceae bacterium]|nr:3-oxoacyl-[acyl-carrier-protein] reductase [Syntrophobacteraceae bacterium]